MPLYYFHIREGDELISDIEGLKLAGEADARLHAVKGARSLLSSAVLQGRLPLGHMILVADADGNTIAEIRYGDAVSPE